jgi:hypothetical protein
MSTKGRKVIERMAAQGDEWAQNYLRKQELVKRASELKKMEQSKRAEAIYKDGKVD